MVSAGSGSKPATLRELLLQKCYPNSNLVFSPQPVPPPHPCPLLSTLPKPKLVPKLNANSILHQNSVPNAPLYSVVHPDPNAFPDPHLRTVRELSAVCIRTLSVTRALLLALHWQTNLTEHGTLTLNLCWLCPYYEALISRIQTLDLSCP